MCEGRRRKSKRRERRPPAKTGDRLIRAGRRHPRTGRVRNPVRHPLQVASDRLEIVAVFHARQKWPKQL
jgi:plasmid stabilization system protein ParE